MNEPGLPFLGLAEAAFEVIDNAAIERARETAHDVHIIIGVTHGLLSAKQSRDSSPGSHARE